MCPFPVSLSLFHFITNRDKYLHREFSEPSRIFVFELLGGKVVSETEIKEILEEMKQKSGDMELS